MRRADIEVPNLPVDVNSWGRSACYPQGSFCPLIDCLSIQHSRFTKPNFRSCSKCLSRSQAGLCVCTLCTISVRAEGTFERLRYLFGGDRPSQTARLTVSRDQFHGPRLEFQYTKGGIPTVTPRRLASTLLSLPPILYIIYRNSISSCSKAPWGLSV